MDFSVSSVVQGKWKLYKIDDVCTNFTSGGTPSRKRLDYYNDGIIPWVKTKELVDKVIYETEEHITVEALHNSNAKLLPVNTVLLAMYGGGTVGELGILGVPAATNQACAAMVVNEERADYRFLYFLLRNHREAIISLAVGGAQQNLSGTLIKNLEFHFPPVEVQRIIGQVLYTIDEKIMANNDLSKTLEEIAQTIFKAWFVDFEPVKAKIAGVKPASMDVETSALLPDSMEESELGLIPTDWEIKVLGDLVTPKKGKTITKATCIDGEVPVVAGGLQPAYFHNMANVLQPAVTVSASGANAGYIRLYLKDIWASDCSFINSELTETVYFGTYS